MPTVKPFRALRYTAAAGPLDELVAPPVRRHLGRGAQRVPGAEPLQRRAPDAAGLRGAGRHDDLAAWRADGVLAEQPERYWWIAQDYVGPDGVARTREGFAASVPVTPYEAGEVLPHERTHAGPKEGRLRLLRATRTQLEPIFVLYDAAAGLRAARRRAGDGCRGERCSHARVADRGRRGDDRHAAPDRRRPPSLRDGRRLSRGEPRGDAYVRRARLVALAGRRDLPDASVGAGARRRSRRSGRPAERRRDALPRQAVHACRDRRRLRAAGGRVVRSRPVCRTPPTPTRRLPPSTAARRPRRSCSSRSPSTRSRGSLTPAT